MKVPFNKLYYTGQEIEYIQTIFQEGNLAGNGRFTRKVSSFLEEKFKIKKVLTTTSGTHALELAALLIDLKAGDEVIMPSFTFPSTANAVMLRGARPVFAEIEKKTLNIDPDDIAKKITCHTRAIIPVHYGGIGCQMDRIMRIADEFGLFVIEDAAQGINASYKGKYLGTWGHLGCYSFHGTKNYSCGEGGALAINIDDSLLLDRAEIMREKGTNRTNFIKGKVDKYSWVDLGSSYLPSDLLMAFLYAQLNQMEQIKSRRKRIHDYYTANLNQYLKSGIIRNITTVPENCNPGYHLFYIVFDSEQIKDKVMFSLQKRGVDAVVHYQPLHSTLMGKSLGYRKGDLPITEKIANSLLRLPMYTDMTETEMEYVVYSLIKVIKEL